MNPSDVDAWLTTTATTHGFGIEALLPVEDKATSMTFELRLMTDRRPVGVLFAGRDDLQSRWWLKGYFDGRLFG